jgi:hypothetical protein
MVVMLMIIMVIMIMMIEVMMMVRMMVMMMVMMMVAMALHQMMITHGEVSTRFMTTVAAVRKRKTRKPETWG